MRTTDITIHASPESSFEPAVMDHHASADDVARAGALDGPQAVTATTREEDEELVRAASSALAALAADPMAAVELARNWIRDLGLDAREESALSASDRARLDTILGEAAREAEAAARAAAASDGLIAKIFGYIGAAIAIAVGTIGAVFSGGATLALAIAAVVLVAGATTASILVDTKAVDADVGGAVALGCSIAATICSLGASAAGSVAQGTAIGVRIATDALNYSSSAVQSVSAWYNGEAAVTSHEADCAAADGIAADTSRADARSELDECADAMRALMRSHRRCGDRAAEVREARAAGMRAACMRI